MIRGQFPNNKQLETIYPLLTRWTNWYFEYRDSNHNGIPEYRHGNESGWDNSTVFAKGVPIESPDLSALLSVQMEVLSKIAIRLGKPGEANRWHQRSDELLKAMLKEFGRHGEFVAIHVADGRPIWSQSLLLSIPIILGKRLPVRVRRDMVAALKQRASMSHYGLVSEPPNSTFYERDGYWRGPIWAPSTMLIATGLREVGENQFSESLEEQFCQMARRSSMAPAWNQLKKKYDTRELGLQRPGWRLDAELLGI